MEDIVAKLVLDLTWVTTNVHSNERGFALSLFGVNSGTFSQVLLLEQCTKQKEFAAFVQPRQDGSFQRTQLACDAAAIDIVRTAITSTLSGHELSYKSARFRGVVEFDPNPSADWRTVQHSDGNFSTNAEIFRHLIFTPYTGTRIDLTHSALITGRVVNDSPVEAIAHVVLPAVTTDGQPLVADVRIDEHGIARGTVKVSGTTIAIIWGTGSQLAFTWRSR